MPVPDGVAIAGLLLDRILPGRASCQARPQPGLEQLASERPDGGSLYGLYVVLGLTWWWAVSEAGAAGVFAARPAGACYAELQRRSIALIRAGGPVVERWVGGIHGQASRRGARCAV